MLQGLQTGPLTEFFQELKCHKCDLLLSSVLCHHTFHNLLTTSSYCSGQRVSYKLLILIYLNQSIVSKFLLSFVNLSSALGWKPAKDCAHILIYMLCLSAKWLQNVAVASFKETAQYIDIFFTQFGKHNSRCTTHAFYTVI